MHELLFGRQKALEDDDLRRYAAQLGLDVAAFDRDRAAATVADRIRRDVDSGLASGQVLGTPTLFIDGVVHRGGWRSSLSSALSPPQDRSSSRTPRIGATLEPSPTAGSWPRTPSTPS
jgi:2-hydroxychromene-2-carboxylate isomerase